MLCLFRLAAGLFTKGGVTPQNFVTLASPHLGALRPPTTAVNRIYNSCVVKYVSRTGRQLALVDDYVSGLPLLYVMCHPDLVFLQVGGAFAHLGGFRVTLEFRAAAAVRLVVCRPNLVFLQVCGAVFVAGLWCRVCLGLKLWCFCAENKQVEQQLFLPNGW